MSTAERDKWDARYRDGAYEGRTHPTALLAEWLPRLPRGHALDVACGTGRNALYLAANGFSVTAVDISRVALDRGRRAAAERGLTVEWLYADLDEDLDSALPPGGFDLVVWARYVHKTLMQHLVARLGLGGALVCEQHLKTDVTVAGPSSAEFRLAPGELRRSAQGLVLDHSYEGLVVDPDGRTVALAQLIGHKTA
ncbi:MAG TPA: class I SAM-dependent methyltransferase [Gammaproteobacteria bacterium]|nr:class I SAM-dependent methyltransferase [Gammaproteobacteria bacterium]